MRIKSSENANQLLQLLLSGDSMMRDHALRSIAPKDREPVRRFMRARKDADLLIEVLFADLGRASNELHNDYGNQFWRRAAIRALAATVDGIIFSVKQLGKACADFSNYQLRVNEIEFLSEKPSQVGKKVRYLKFSDNFQETFKLFSKIRQKTCATNFSDDGFNALCETFELRHRVMHPKSFVSFGVNDDETKRAGKAIAWLHQELQRLLNPT